MLNLHIRIKVSFKSQKKRGFFPSVHFSNDFKQMFQFELHPHIGEIRTEILVYEEGGVIKHIKATARVSCMSVVCLSLCPRHGSLSP